MVLGLVAGISAAQADEWNTSWDGALYGYASRTVLNDASVLNPQNRVARLAQAGETAEARLNFKAESDQLRFSARPILLAQDTRNVYGGLRAGEAYLSQWQARWRVAEQWSAAVGRDVLNWGGGQFRSPSSPFYFDNGRSNPMRELSGMDAVKVSWTPSVSTALTVARLAGSGHRAAGNDSWRNGWLAKWDQRGEDWATGLVAAQAAGQSAFFGMHGQQTLGEAWLLYGEAGLGRRSPELISQSNLSQPFGLLPEGPRRAVWLMGAAYTFDNGQSMHAEWLHDDAGYTRSESDAYFARAAVSPLQAGMALGNAPRLLNRNYLHLVWQSSLVAEEGYARLMFTRNLEGGGYELGGYAERNLNGRIAAFALAVVTSGGARSEFNALFSRVLTVGLKLALP